MKLQKMNKYQYFITVPLDLVKSMKWEKGKELKFKIVNGVVNVVEDED